MADIIDLYEWARTNRPELLIAFHEAQIADHTASLDALRVEGALTGADAPSAPAPVAMSPGRGVPAMPADQVAWVVNRQRTHGDVTWQLIAEHLGLSTRQAQRRLTDARKSDAAAFAA